MGKKVTDITMRGERVVQLIGDKELLREFNKLEAKFQRRLLRPAINVGLTPIMKRAKANAPIDDGYLKKEIKKKVNKTGAWGKVYVNSQDYTDENGKRKNPAHYAHLLEFGTRHSAEQKFMRPALQSGRGEALKKIQDHMRKNLQLVAK